MYGNIQASSIERATKELTIHSERRGMEDNVTAHDRVRDLRLETGRHEASGAIAIAIEELREQPSVRSVNEPFLASSCSKLNTKKVENKAVREDRRGEGR